jgi:hypothetical protein
MMTRKKKSYYIEDFYAHPANWSISTGNLIKKKSGTRIVAILFPFFLKKIVFLNFELNKT